MYKPILTIDLPKLRDNARVEKKELGEHGIEVMAVNKVFNGCVATARAVLEGGIDVIAESRTYNLKKLKDALGCRTCLLRSPVLSEIETSSATPIFRLTQKSQLSRRFRQKLSVRVKRMKFFSWSTWATSGKGSCSITIRTLLIR